MPLKLWLQWMGWAKTQGPLGALGDDFRAADIAMRTALPYTAKSKRELINFLPPWREPTDYLPWGIRFETDGSG